jgi:hypothetical protein
VSRAPCLRCGASLEGRSPAARFCGDTCRKAHSVATKKAVKAAAPEPPVSTAVADALMAELQKLGVADTYEAAVAFGLATQLDAGSVRGAAYASLSKELDRRVDALRLKGVLPNDPGRAAEESLAAMRASLRSA